MNVCRHRGALVATASARRGTLQCPYHAWTYGLDGALRAAPRSDLEPCFDHDALGLLPVSVDTWGPFVFVNSDPDAGPLAAALGDLPEVVASHGLDVDALEYRRRYPYELRANWKIAVENYLECYHCAVNHPGFVDAVDDRALRLETGPTRLSQFAPVHARALERRKPYDVRGELDTSQFHILLPAMKFNVSPGRPNLSIGPVWPVAPDRCAGYLDYFFAPGVSEEWLAEFIEWDFQVGAEDVALVEGVQAGAASGALADGRPAGGHREPDRRLPGVRAGARRARARRRRLTARDPFTGSSRPGYARATRRGRAASNLWSVHARLGLNVHRDAWPTSAVLAAYEAAGYAWVQVHTPPPAMLAERRHGLRHARAVRSALDDTGLRLLVHAPDDLSAGDRRARPCVRRPARLRRRGGRRARRLPRTQLRGSRRPCGRAPPRARPARGAVPHPASPAGAFPWPHRRDREPRAGLSAAQRRRSHDPLAVRDLVRRLDQPAAGMLLDLGHLHITADATRSDHAAVLAACAPDVVLFHVHDNLGCRRGIDAPGVDPIRLDLHLPPGRGSLPWARIAGMVAAHDAPVMLEVERSHRPALEVLAAETTRLLALDGAAAAAA